MSGYSGRGITEARTREARDIDGGLCESTKDPVLSWGGG